MKNCNRDATSVAVAGDKELVVKLGPAAPHNRAAHANNTQLWVQKLLICGFDSGPKLDEPTSSLRLASLGAEFLLDHIPVH